MAATLALVFAAVACSGNDSARIEGVWLLDSVAVDGVFLDLEPELSARNELGVPAWVAFGAQAGLSGAGPCNDFSGQYVFDGTHLASSDVYSELQGCTGDSRALEELVVDLLASADVHFSSDVRMQWQGENAIVTFRRQP